MARPKNTEQRRGQIVDGFLRVLPRRGYAGASIAAIAAEAGLGAGLVHYHFENKRALLVASAEVLSERLAARVAGHAEEGPRAAMHAWVDAHLALGPDADPAAAAAWAALGAEAQRDEEVRAVYLSALTASAASLRAAVAPLAPGRCDAVARIGVTLVEGALRVAAGAPGFLPAGSAAVDARAALDALVNGASA